MDSVADTDDYYEKPDTPRKQTPLRPSQAAKISPKQKTTAEYLNNLNEPPLPDLEALCRVDLDEKNLYVSAGRGRGPHKMRNYAIQPPVKVVKELPHCLGLPVFLATRGVLARPAPGRNYNYCPEIARGRGKGIPMNF